MLTDCSAADETRTEYDDICADVSAAESANEQDMTAAIENLDDCTEDIAGALDEWYEAVGDRRADCFEDLPCGL